MIPQLREWFEHLPPATNPEQLGVMKAIVTRLLAYDQFEDQHKEEMKAFVLNESERVVQISATPSGDDPAP